MGLCCKKICLLLLFLIPCHSLVADTYRFNGAQGSNWTSQISWQNQTAGTNGWEIPGGIDPPDADDQVRFNYSNTSGYLSSDAGTIGALQIGVDESGHLILDIGARLTVSGGWSGIGAGGSCIGSLTLDGGLLHINSDWMMGVNNNPHTATLTINGGTMEVAGNFIQSRTTTEATVTLNGGVLEVDTMTLEAGVIDLRGGKLILGGDQRQNVWFWRTSGYLNAYGGDADSMVHANYVNGKTEVTAVQSEFRTKLLDLWASKKVFVAPYNSFDNAYGRDYSPRVLLAKLENSEDVAQVNNYLQNISPWGDGAGSDNSASGFDGDYDFALVTLMTILYRHGEDQLTQQTVDYMLNTVLRERAIYHFTKYSLSWSMQDEINSYFDLVGQRSREVAPTFASAANSYGENLLNIKETENHFLMTEGCRYLKNQWLREKKGLTDSKYNNDAGGLTDRLVSFIQSRVDEGCFNEYNADPYQQYSLQAVLNLAEFASSPGLRDVASQLIEQMVRSQVAASLDFRSKRPWYRNSEGLRDTDNGSPFHDNYNVFSYMALNSTLLSWANDPLDQPLADAILYSDPNNDTEIKMSQRPLLGAVSNYRPSPELLGALVAERKPYFIKFGRGEVEDSGPGPSSPEILSGGPGYLLSAGGIDVSPYYPPTFGEWGYAHRTMLLLEDGAEDVRDCFHFEDNVPEQSRNNTGVYEKFACGPGEVSVPSRYSPEHTGSGWMIFRPYPDAGLRIAVHNGTSGGNYGILALFPGYEGTAQQLVSELTSANASNNLRSKFTFPGGQPTVEYDVGASATRYQWMITAVNGSPVERDYTKWQMAPAAFSNVTNWFHVYQTQKDALVTVPSAEANTPLRPKMYYLDIPQGGDTYVVETSGFNGTDTGLAFGRDAYVPKRAAPRFPDAAQIVQLEGGLQWIGAYTTTNTQQNTFKIRSPGTFYWEGNGTTSGFGTAGGTWAESTADGTTQGWSDDANGQASTERTATSILDDVHFGTTQGLSSGTITVSGTVGCKDIYFGSASGNITLTGGVIQSDDDVCSVYVPGADRVQTINSDLLVDYFFIRGAGTLCFYGTNTKAGRIRIGDGTSSNLTVRFNTIGNVGGGATSLGAPTSAGEGNIQIGQGSYDSTLEFINATAAQSTDRTVQIGSDGTGGASLLNNNEDLDLAISFTNPEFNIPVNYTVTSNNRTLRLGGRNAGTNTIFGVIADNGASAIALIKQDAGKWILNGINTYTDQTKILGGTLALGAGGSIDASSALLIHPGAILDTTAHSTYAIPSGQSLTLKVDPSGSGSCGQLAASGLDISGAQINLDVSAPPDDEVYVLASYSTLNGAASATISNVPNGYEVDMDYEGNQIALVPISTDYTWMQGGGLENSVWLWNDPANWSNSLVPPERWASKLVFGSTTGSGESDRLGLYGTNVTINSMEWDSSFQLQIGAWRDRDTGFTVDTGSEDPAILLAKSGILDAYYVNWTLNSPVLLTGNGTLTLKAGNDISGPGGFTVDSGATLHMSATHQERSYSFSGGIEIMNGGSVRFENKLNNRNSQLGTGRITIHEGGVLETVAADPLANEVLFDMNSTGTDQAMLTGSQSTVLDGTFRFDLTDAGASPGDQWQIIATDKPVAYGDAFQIDGFSESDGLWASSTNGTTYRYDQSTGVLRVFAGYVAWIAGYDVGIQNGFTNDFDRDGLGNGLEYFYGSDPRTADTGLRIIEGSSTNVSVRHPQNPQADDVTVRYQWSKDLSSFYEDGASDGSTQVDFSPQLNNPEADTTTVGVTVSGEPLRTLFIRLQADWQ